jgi:hypothetical protein
MPGGKLILNFGWETSSKLVIQKTKWRKRDNVKINSYLSEKRCQGCKLGKNYIQWLA